MKKRIYRATSVKSVNSEALIERIEDQHLLVNVDVAKSGSCPMENMPLS